MRAKQKIVQGRGPSLNINLGIFVCSFDVCGLHNQSPLLTMPSRIRSGETRSQTSKWCVEMIDFFFFFGLENKLVNCQSQRLAQLHSLNRPYRGILVYNICLISISILVSDGATNKSVLNIERSY